MRYLPHDPHDPAGVDRPTDKHWRYGADEAPGETPVGVADGWVAAIVPLASAQTYCGLLAYLDTQTRRISASGNIMVECGNECALWSCEDPPWGNFGVQSSFGSRTDSTQFPGWKSWDGKRQWNAGTLQYYGGPYVNDGGGQRAEPDNRNNAGRKPWPNLTKGPRHQTCRDWLGEVYTVDNVKIAVYEMDHFLRTSDDKISTLDSEGISSRCSAPTPSSGRAR